MLTDAANAFSEAIQAKARYYDECARNDAVSYANSDDKNCQIAYRNNSALAEIFRKLHADACQAMHAIESEMRQKYEKAAKAP